MEIPMTKFVIPAQAGIHTRGVLVASPNVANLFAVNVRIGPGLRQGDAGEQS